MRSHKEERLQTQVEKLQVLVDFYREDWQAMIKQLEEAEQRAEHWYEECKKLINEKCELIMGKDVKV